MGRQVKPATCPKCLANVRRNPKGQAKCIKCGWGAIYKF